MGTNGTLMVKKGIRKSSNGSNDKHASSAESSAVPSGSPRSKKNDETGRSGKSKRKESSAAIQRNDDGAKTACSNKLSNNNLEPAEAQNLRESTVDTRDDLSPIEDGSRSTLGGRERSSSSEEKSNTIHASNNDKKDIERETAGCDQDFTRNVGEEMKGCQIEHPSQAREGALEQPNIAESDTAKMTERYEEVEVEYSTNDAEVNKCTNQEGPQTLLGVEAGNSQINGNMPRSPRPSSSKERDSENQRERRKKKSSSKSKEHSSQERGGKSRHHSNEKKRDDSNYVDDDATEFSGFTNAHGNDCGVGGVRGQIKEKIENGVEEVQGTTQDILLSVFQICCAFALRGKEINDFVKEIDNARAELR